MRTRHTARQIVRVGKYALVATAVFAASLMLLTCVLFVALLAADVLEVLTTLMTVPSGDLTKNRRTPQGSSVSG